MGIESLAFGYAVLARRARWTAGSPGAIRAVNRAGGTALIGVGALTAPGARAA